MRPRNIIEKDFVMYREGSVDVSVNEELILEVLLDVRALLLDNSKLRSLLLKDNVDNHHPETEPDFRR